MTRPANAKIAKKIMQVAIEEISKNGVENISMRKIAELVKVTPTTIYYYFKNKDELFDNIKFNVFKEMNNYVINKINNNDDSLKQIKDLIKYFSEWLLNNQNRVELVFDKLPPNFDIAENFFNEYYALNYKAIEIIKNGNKQNIFNSKDPDSDATVGFSMIYGFIKLFFHKRLMPKFLNDPQLIINKIIKILIDHIINK